VVLLNGQSAHLGTRLKQLREDAGLTLRQLEHETGVARSWLSKMEADPSPNPSLSVLLALQRAFKLNTIEALLGDLPSELSGVSLSARLVLRSGDAS